MSLKTLKFSYDKTVVMNALYDTIESLGLKLDSSNTSRGTLIVSGDQRKQTMRVAIDVDIGTGKTCVGFFSDGTNEKFADSWGNILLDELVGRMEKMHRNK